MSGRLDDIPVYELIETSIDASNYNLVQIAFKRLGEPIGIPLTGLRRLELILDHDAWIVVDHDMNDIPILAWTDFQVEDRSTLHESVLCHLKSYHMHASIILERVTDFMEKELAIRISERKKNCEIENIIMLKKQ